MLQIRIAVVREPARPAEGRRRHRLFVLTSTLTLVAVALVASAGAAPTTDTTAVGFVDIPAKQVWSGNSISPGKAESVTVIGGTTTVPTNATTVRLVVTVKGAAAGTLRFYPAGNEAGGAGHTASWGAGGTTTVTTAENVGLQDKVTVFNDSTKAAAVTVKITGYSTQVTAGDINGSGGTAGQVLTNNGTGGAVWRDLPDDAAGTTFSAVVLNGTTPVTVGSLTLQKGTYLFVLTSEFENHAPAVNTAQCQVKFPGGGTAAQTRQTATDNLQSGSVALTGLVTTVAGGTLTAQCRSLQGLPGTMYDTNLMVAQVGATPGGFTKVRQVPRRH